MQTVVGAVIVEDGLVLAARRRGGALAGRWEFPGGKVEPGETPEGALRRELHEELALEVEVGAEIPAPGVAWPISDAYELRLFLARIVVGVPAPGPDHDAVQWLGADQLDDVEWLPSDAQALAAVSQALGW